jgi:hypothetical protein
MLVPDFDDATAHFTIGAFTCELMYYPLINQLGLLLVAWTAPVVRASLERPHGRNCRNQLAYDCRLAGNS